MAAFAAAAAFVGGVGGGGGGGAAEVDVVVGRGVEGVGLADGRRRRRRHPHGLEPLGEDPDRLLLRLGAHHVQRRLLQISQ